MSGGIFVDRSFHPNPKCLVFAGLLMTVYWFLPSRRNIFMLPFIFVVSYVALAWYDYFYACNETMLSGIFLGPNTFDAIFKPQRRGAGEIKKDTVTHLKFIPDQEGAYLKRVYMFHVLAVAPLVCYVGYMGRSADARVFAPLLGVGVLALLYHGYRYFSPREPCALNNRKNEHLHDLSTPSNG